MRRLGISTFTVCLLKQYTENFSEDNFIANFQFGKVYRGFQILACDAHRSLMVKIWDPTTNHIYMEEDEIIRLCENEMVLLQHERFNYPPDLVQLYGYCLDGEMVAIVYELKPVDTVHNLVPKDYFSWTKRIKVALRFAHLLRFFHGQNPAKLHFLIGNISAAHIIVDEDYNPKLFDFSTISGGIFPDKVNPEDCSLHGCHGYVDPANASGGGSDVFAFGVLLLMLITKRVYIEDNKMNECLPYLYDWARKQYSPKKSLFGLGQVQCSLVDRSLEEDPSFCPSDGFQVTELAIQCVEMDPRKRPSVNQIVKCLQNLHVVPRQFRRKLGFNKIPCVNCYSHADISILPEF